MIRFLFILIFLCGCRCDFDYRMDGKIVFREQGQELYQLYTDRNIRRLSRLLQADVWLLDQHHECQLLAPKELRVLQDRIHLVQSMVNSIRASK